MPAVAQLVSKPIPSLAQIRKAGASANGYPIRVVGRKDKVNPKIPFQVTFFEAAHWWFHQLRWTESAGKRPPGSPLCRYQVSFYELAIAFAAATGLPLLIPGQASSTWGQKARLIGNVMRGIYRVPILMATLCHITPSLRPLRRWPP